MTDIQSENTPTESNSEASESTPTPMVTEQPAAEVPAAEVPAAKGPSAEVPAAEVPAELTEEQIAAKEAERVAKDAERKKKEEEKKIRDEAFEELTALKGQDGVLEFTVQERVKGGLRGEYKGLRLFLPASQFGMRKSVAEEELNATIGTVLSVKVHELQSDDTGYKSAVVSRKDLVATEFWSGIETGGVHDGVVTSVTVFGAFVNIGGVEGLVHVSKLSNSRIDNPSDVVKKGDKLKVTITAIDKEKKKLSLSHKEHEEDPWKHLGPEYPTGKRVKGVVKRITQFGAYVQIAPKIEGLVRISELSWGIRVKAVSDILTEGQEIEVEVLSFDAEKHQISLGYRQTLPNPWESLAEKLPIGSDVDGVVQQLSTQGAVIRIHGEIDGFMPRSKMSTVGKDRKAPFQVGETVSCGVVDINAGSNSLILGMKNEAGEIVSAADERQHDRSSDRSQERSQDRSHSKPSHKQFPDSSTASSSVTLGDMLKDMDKSNLLK